MARFDYLMEEGREALTEADTLIVCGDFGFVFRNDQKERYYLDLLEKKPYTIAFCCGNHENFSALFSYPEEMWNGGKVHRIRKNIFHLMRGQIFTLEESRFFVMGGAYSIDKAYRKENVSWWAQELPSPKEYKEATVNLTRYNRKVDFIVSHTAPREIIRRMGHEPSVHDGELTGFLEWVMYEVDYQKWFFGHWHKDMKIDSKHRALWFDVERIGKEIKDENEYE